MKKGGRVKARLLSACSHARPDFHGERSRKVVTKSKPTIVPLKTEVLGEVSRHPPSQAFDYMTIKHLCYLIHINKGG